MDHHRQPKVCLDALAPKRSGVTAVPWVTGSQRFGIPGLNQPYQQLGIDSELNSSKGFPKPRQAARSPGRWACLVGFAKGLLGAILPFTHIGWGQWKHRGSWWQACSPERDNWKISVMLPTVWGEVTGIWLTCSTLYGVSLQLLSLLRFLKINVCVCVCLCTCVFSTHRDQKRTSGPLNYSYRWLWAAIWVLGTELGPLQDQQMLLNPDPSL